MNDSPSPKIFAPKPVRANSNKFGRKLLHSAQSSHFEKITEMKSGNFSPQPIRGRCFNNESVTFSRFISCGNQSNQMDSPINSTTDKENKFIFECEDEPNERFSLVNFEKCVELDFKNLTVNEDETLCKSEILSILRNDTTLCDSTHKSGHFSVEDDFTCEGIRASMPPSRVNNPLYKNFETPSQKNKIYHSQILNFAGQS